ncbi:hypothetical protein EV363DRAFT_1294396 [Boletus edulis]|nr:hypothetical protein EV363DRAFT_1294396 [Boletus edulis]
MDVDDVGPSKLFLSGSSSSSIGKEKQSAIKRTADQMQMDSNKEKEHMRQMSKSADIMNVSPQESASIKGGFQSIQIYYVQIHQELTILTVNHVWPVQGRNVFQSYIDQGNTDKEGEHMRQSQHPHLEPEEERESSDDEAQGDTTTVNVQSYIWEMFHKAMKEGEFEVDFDTTPILLHILQHVLAMAKLKEVDITDYIDCITNWDLIPTAQEILVVIQSVARHLDDSKYIDAAEMWAGSTLAMMPSTATDSNIYSIKFFEKQS